MKNPYKNIKFEKRNAVLTNKEGKTIFEKEVIFPDFYNENSINIISNKYLCNSAKKQETKLTDMIDRVSERIAEWGKKDEYFKTDKEYEEFLYNLKYYQIHQYFAFNSPVYFNVGLNDKEQCSACFILSVDDSMESITDLAKTESIIFKNGSGAGSNLSKLRGSNEKVHGGGTASGPVSFLKSHDCQAGIIKSGGTLRRSAKLSCLDIDHPDIKKFITCKDKEELKMKILMEAGIEPEEGYEMSDEVFLQNTNLSVRITDDFIKAVKENDNWYTINRLDGSIANTYKAQDLLMLIAEQAWKTGDPGVQFHDIINKMNPVPSHGSIDASNPCQPDFATVLTPEGIKQFKDIDIGSVIWSGHNWTTVINKQMTGIKPVYRYSTTRGHFIGTENHNIFCNGKKIPVNETDSIDTCLGGLKLSSMIINPKDVINGLLIGDGSIHKANNNMIYLNIGKNDYDYFNSEVSSFIKEQYGGEKSVAYKINTDLNSKYLVHTYNRKIPNKYRYGSIEEICGFLRGLYSANGSVIKTKNTTRITLKQTSFELILQIQEMLSSIGIHSYYTINKSNDVIFKNGKKYTCKQSYDLNITNDRKLFHDYIGFIQKYKMEKLQCGLNIKGKVCNLTSSVKSIEFLGKMPVYSITVSDEQHRYWTGGLLVANCSEYMFLDNTSCNLASYNVKKFVNNDGSFDYEKLEKVISTVITAMDIIVDNAYYPIDSVEKNTKKYRSLGLGYSNLGATLMSMGLPYDSKKAREFASLLTAITTGICFKTSQKLAEDVGLPKWWSGTTKKSMYKVLNNHYSSLINVMTTNYNEMKNYAIDLWKDVIKEQKPIRNTQVTLLAPTGTISFIMGCDTFGIEPEFSLIKYKRLSGSEGSTVKTINQSIKHALISLNYNEKEVDVIINQIINGKAIEKIKELKSQHYAVFDTAMPFNDSKRCIHYKGHLKMMAATQPFLSGSISKTVNIPSNSTVKDIYSIYLKAWEMGLKSVALYRDGSKAQQVLYTKKEQNNKVIDQRKKMPTDRNGITHKFTINGNVKGYITANSYEDGELGEVFVNIAKTGSTLNGLLDSLFTLTSISLQYGVPLEVLSKKLIGSKFEPAGFTRNNDIRSTTSLVDYIFRYLAINFLSDDKLIKLGLKSNQNSKEIEKESIDMDISTSLCPECGALLKKLGSCEFCDQCAWNGGACS